ncbi:MAG: cytochrome C oxidase subunit IV family protein [Verrucomicrobiota bacterium]|nr:cytochrome C oxidase subunit IV family protein [Verrucomicrobiota bacterium]
MNETHTAPAGEMVAPGEHTPHDDHHDVSKHVKKYLLVGGVLLAFTALTVFLSYVDFGSRKTNIAVGMLVAAVKAGMVAGIFMHLSAERKLIYRILIFTAMFVFALFWLTYLHWYDPISR